MAPKFSSGFGKCYTRLAYLVKVLFLIGILSSNQFNCASRVQKSRKPPVNPRELLRKDRDSLTRVQKIYFGKASYYGTDFHGKKTASGEIFDMHQLTAAHRWFPFGTICRVVNLNNRKSVVVRINDRGPFVRDRIIDLSYEAAKAIGAIGEGVIDVRIEVLKWGQN